jgi:hypothetical protein
VTAQRPSGLYCKLACCTLLQFVCTASPMGARRPLLDNGSVITFPQQRIRLKKQCIAYRVTSIPRQSMQKRFRSHGSEPLEHSNSEERDNCTGEGGDLHAVRPKPTSGRELANRIRQKTNRSQKKSQVKYLKLPCSCSFSKR